MSDVEKAAHLLDEVIGYRGVREPVKSMLERAYSKLRTQSKEWTRRRVRSIFNKEAKRIDNFEMEQMRAVIAARNAHAKFKEETSRIASMGVL